MDVKITPILLPTNSRYSTYHVRRSNIMHKTATWWERDIAIVELPVGSWSFIFWMGRNFDRLVNVGTLIRVTIFIALWWGPIGRTTQPLWFFVVKLILQVFKIFQLKPKDHKCIINFPVKTFNLLIFNSARDKRVVFSLKCIADTRWSARLVLSVQPYRSASCQVPEKG